MGNALLNSKVQVIRRDCLDVPKELEVPRVDSFLPLRVDVIVELPLDKAPS